MDPALRAAAHLDAEPEREWTTGSLGYELLDGPKAAGPTSVAVVVRVTRDGADVTPDAINPIVVTNPPLLVADPSGDVDLGERGRFRTDPAAALREIVEGVVASLLND